MRLRPLLEDNALIDPPMLAGPASTLKSLRRPAALSVLTVASNAALTRLFTSILPSVVVLGNTIDPPFTPDLMTHCAIASPPMAAADASWPVWLMALRS